MGHVLRHDPIGIDFSNAYPKCINQFEKPRWIPFFQKLQGYDNEVTKAFVRYFDGGEVQIGDVQFVLT
jgi:hypothetical protein